MERRRFLRFAIAAPAVALLACKGKPAPKGLLARAGLKRRRCRVLPRAQGPGRVLNAREWATLEAVSELIYPADAGKAGARQAQAINYIDAQLTQPPVDAFKPLLRVGAMHLDRLAKGRGKPTFDALDATAQEQVLKQLQRRRLGRYSGGSFVRIMLALTLEGMFADPLYGGNHERSGWKGIGFKPQLPAPRCPWGGVGEADSAGAAAPTKGGA